MNLPCLGIDIAKVKFNACLLHLTGKLKHKVFSNNPTGFAQLQEWLAKQGVQQVHACLEATGIMVKRSHTTCTTAVTP